MKVLKLLCLLDVDSTLALRVLLRINRIEGVTRLKIYAGVNGLLVMPTLSSVIDDAAMPELELLVLTFAVSALKMAPFEKMSEKVIFIAIGFLFPVLLWSYSVWCEED